MIDLLDKILNSEKLLKRVLIGLFVMFILSMLFIFAYMFIPNYTGIDGSDTFVKLWHGGYDTLVINDAVVNIANDDVLYDSDDGPYLSMDLFTSIDFIINSTNNTCSLIIGDDVKVLDRDDYCYVEDLDTWFVSFDQLYQYGLQTNLVKLSDTDRYTDKTSGISYNRKTRRVFTGYDMNVKW